MSFFFPSFSIAGEQQIRLPTPKPPTPTLTAADRLKKPLTASVKDSGVRNLEKLHRDSAKLGKYPAKDFDEKEKVLLSDFRSPDLRKIRKKSTRHLRRRRAGNSESRERFQRLNSPSDQLVHQPDYHEPSNPYSDRNFQNRAQQVLLSQRPARHPKDRPDSSHRTNPYGSYRPNSRIYNYQPSPQRDQDYEGHFQVYQHSNSYQDNSFSNQGQSIRRVGNGFNETMQPKLFVKVVKLEVPRFVNRSDDVKLECKYNMTIFSLYSLKWYRNDVEIFRYMPKDPDVPDKPQKIAMEAGFNVDVSNV